MPMNSQNSRALGIAAIEKYRYFFSRGNFKEAFRYADMALDCYPYDDGFERLARHSNDGLTYPVSARELNSYSLDSNDRMKIALELENFSCSNPSSPWPYLLQITSVAKQSRNIDYCIERMAFVPKKYQWMRNFSGFYYLAHCPLDPRFYGKANEEFSAAFNGDFRNWQARAHQAEIFLCQGNLEAAFSVFDQLLNQLTGDSRAAALAWRGELFLWTGQYRLAVQDLENAAKARAPSAFCWLGATYLKLKRIPLALKSLNIALALDPNDKEARIWRSEAYWSSGDWEKAEQDIYWFKRVENASPVESIPWWAYAERARILSQHERSYIQALQNFNLIPENLRRILFSRIGYLGKLDDVSADIMDKSLRELFKISRGVRRSEGYLYPLIGSENIVCVDR